MSIAAGKNNGIALLPQQEFLDEIPRLYSPFEQYVKGVIPSMLEHVWQLRMTKGTYAMSELQHCAWIARLITLDKRVLDTQKQNDVPGWIALREDVVRNIERCQNATGVPAMVNACMEAIGPIIEQRFQPQYHFPLRPFHCWWYTIHEEGTHLALHLVNAYQPDSPFRHEQHFITTMLQAVEHAINIYPQIKIVSCGSWLNQLPAFQHFWPEAFKQAQKVLNETGGFGPGAWGQYMTTNGGFNETKAAELRNTGKHPFALTEAQCPVMDLRQHLETLIADVKQ
jgi:hypothetical protein